MGCPPWFGDQGRVTLERERRLDPSENGNDPAKIVRRVVGLHRRITLTAYAAPVLRRRPVEGPPQRPFHAGIITASTAAVRPPSLSTPQRFAYDYRRTEGAEVRKISWQISPMGCKGRLPLIHSLTDSCIPCDRGF